MQHREKPLSPSIRVEETAHNSISTISWVWVSERAKFKLQCLIFNPVADCSQTQIAVNTTCRNSPKKTKLAKISIYCGCGFEKRYPSFEKQSKEWRTRRIHSYGKLHYERESIKTKGGEFYLIWQKNALTTKGHNPSIQLSAINSGEDGTL